MQYAQDNINKIKENLQKFESNPNNYVCEIGFKNNINNIHSGHAYALKKIYTLNGEKFVTIIDPYDSNKDINMKYSNFVNSINSMAFYKLT